MADLRELPEVAVGDQPRLVDRLLNLALDRNLPGILLQSRVRRAGIRELDDHHPFRQAISAVRPVLTRLAVASEVGLRMAC
jgi:hypothetical protein